MGKALQPDPQPASDAPIVVWEPRSHPQAAFIACPVFEIFFGGARGSLKTDSALGDWISHEELYGEHAIGLMVRRSRTQLAETYERAKQIFVPLGFKFNDSDHTCKGPTGGRLRFAYLERDADAENYQGHSYTRVYVEEIGNFPSQTPIMKLMATLRSAHGVPCGFRGTGNPGGPGHGWVKKRYIDPAPGGWKIIDEEFVNPFTKEVTIRQRIFIPGKITDHNLLGAGYVANLQMSGSAELVRAWLEGDWDVIAGAYFPEFSKGRHVIVETAFPADWRRFTASDWGSSRPFWTGWFVIIQKEMTVQSVLGQIVTLLPGAIACYREWYGEDEKRPGQNLGLKLPIEEWAKGVITRCKDETILYHVVDTSMFSEDGGPSLAERAMRVKVKGKGLVLRKADKQRLPGWNQIRFRLRGDHGPENSPPMLFFTQFCPDAIRTLSALQHDDVESKYEDAETSGEDHPCFAAGTVIDGRGLVERVGALTRRKASVVRVYFNNGASVVCTPDHLFMGANGEWIRADKLTKTRLCSVERLKNSEAFDIISAAFIFSARACDCIAWCGSAIAATFLTVSMFITETMIAAITRFPISNCYEDRSIRHFTAWGETLNSVKRRERALHYGTVARLDSTGTESNGPYTPDQSWQSASRRLARFAGNLMRRAASLRVARSIATKTAKPLHCVAVEQLSERRDVYCLATRDAWLSVEGIVASNCDGIRYACMSRPRKQPEKETFRPTGPKHMTFDWLIAQGKGKPSTTRIE